MARIVVDRAVALYDTPVAIAVEHVTPGGRVTVTATWSITSGGCWRSHATFVADNTSRIDLTRQAPVDGTYAGISAMGLFWSAVPVRGETPMGPGSIMESRLVRLVAESDRDPRAEVMLERRIAGAGVTCRPVRDAGVIGTLFLPPGDDPRPGVIVLGGSDGGFSEHRAALIASHGYAALALGYFRGPGLPDELANIPLEYFENAVRWIHGQPWLRDGFLAVWGASRGGELALLLGATIPEISAVVAYAPSGVLHGDFAPTGPGDEAPKAAWTYRGEPLPYLQQDNTADDPSSVNRGKPPVAESPRYLALLRDAHAVERATIPVEKTQGPILLVSGRDDAIWPSSVLADIAVRRLQEHRHAFPFRHLSYDGAGHGLFVPYAPTTQIVFVHPLIGVQYTGGGSPSANAEASADAWLQVLAFLDEAVSARR